MGHRRPATRRFPLGEQEIEPACQNDDRNQVEDQPDEFQEQPSIVPEMQWSGEGERLCLSGHLAEAGDLARSGMDQDRCDDVLRHS